MLSIGLVGTWIYHLYDKTQYTQRRNEVYIKDSMAVAQGVSDSLRKIYSNTIDNLGNQLSQSRISEDSAQTELGSKVKEIYSLKGEIEGILKKKNTNEADLSLARQKIATLQSLIKDLNLQKDDMEVEKERLNGVLSQLSGEITDLHQNIKKLDDENKALTEKVSLASVFVATDMKLTPVTLKNFKEQETSQAKKATKFVVSFAVKNNVNEYTNADVFVVIKQPNGEIVKNDEVWENTVTTSANGGKINYTRKIRFDYEKGETKRLFFSVNAKEYLRGNYTLELYHNGYEIGETSSTLN
jgi:chromosome segregation ATPase